MGVSPVSKALGAELRRIRLKRGLTQGALAQRIGVSLPLVKSWECGRRVPSLGDLGRIASGLRLRASGLGMFLGKAIDSVPREVQGGESPAGDPAGVVSPAESSSSSSSADG